MQDSDNKLLSTHLLIEFCTLIGRIGWETIDLIRDLNQSNNWQKMVMVGSCILTYVRELPIGKKTWEGNHNSEEDT